jgi:hypothetical protein
LVEQYVHAGGFVQPESEANEGVTGRLYDNRVAACVSPKTFCAAHKNFLERVGPLAYIPLDAAVQHKAKPPAGPLRVMTAHRGHIA